MSFNSRPHAEVDFDLDAFVHHVDRLSTHDLTQRSTRIFCGAEPDDKLSTHDLTQRSTVILFSMNDSRNFQLTTSRRGRRFHDPFRQFPRSFNSRPHAEVDFTVIPNEIIRNLSTHDLTQRSTCDSGRICLGRDNFQLTTSRRGRLSRTNTANMKVIFQLTTSRRGRRLHSAHFTIEVTFNSRPHAEVDVLPPLPF